MTTPLNVLRIDARDSDPAGALADLRRRLSPQGDIVSQRGRQLTVEVFGEPLSPAQVVERICDDVRDRGLEALLHYSAKLDKAEITPETLRVREDELAAAHAAAEAEFLDTVRRILLDLRLSVLESMGFLPALQWHLERVHEQTGLHTTFMIDGEGCELSYETSVTLYRILQEALGNIIQHAAAD